MPYIHSQGFMNHPQFGTVKEAVKAVREQVKIDVVDCRRKFGSAVVKVYNDRVWTVQATKEDMGPMWSRHNIHDE
jgi:hypothetical protein